MYIMFEDEPEEIQVEGEHLEKEEKALVKQSTAPSDKLQRLVHIAFYALGQGLASVFASMMQKENRKENVR
jgi:hypothetical protein